MADIIIPCLNEESTIGRLVESATQYGDVYVIDDGSTDHTAEIAADSGANVSRANENRGKARAIWVGLQQSNSPIVILLDGDLLGLLPRHLEQLEETYDQGKHFDQVGARVAHTGSALTGQRCSHRVFWELVCENAEGWNFEIAANRIARNSAWLDWPDVSHRPKVEKYGKLEGIIGQAKMFWKILTY